MAIMDAELILSGTKASGAAATVGQTVVATSPVASTSYIDTLAAGDAIKSGAVLHVVSTEIFAGTAASAIISLQTCAESTFTSPTTLVATGSILNANTAAGTVLLQTPIPVGCLRYLRLVVTANTGSYSSTGAIAAWIDLNQSIGYDKQY
jgi:hypothetical protein